ncbi:MAG: transposase [Candidatus Acidiferrales bacterium]
MLGVGAWGGSDMPKGLQRIYGQGHLHFITFSCYRRLPLLRSARARNVFVHTLDRVRREYGFKLVGFVVMPEHVHLLISEPARGTPSTVLKMLKQRVSRLPQAQTAPPSPGFAGDAATPAMQPLAEKTPLEKH